MIFFLLERRWSKAEGQEWILDSFSSISSVERLNTTSKQSESSAGLWHTEKVSELENRMLVDMQADKTMAKEMYRKS